VKPGLWKCQGIRTGRIIGSEVAVEAVDGNRTFYNYGTFTCDRTYLLEDGELTDDDRKVQAAWLVEQEQKTTRLANERAAWTNFAIERLAQVANPVERLVRAVAQFNDDYTLHGNSPSPNWGVLQGLFPNLWRDTLPGGLFTDPPWDSAAIQDWFQNAVKGRPSVLTIAANAPAQPRRFSGRGRAAREDAQQRSQVTGWTFPAGGVRRALGAAREAETVTLLTDGRLLDGEGRIIPGPPNLAFTANALRRMGGLARLEWIKPPSG
jgi:hypothetical protein